MMQHAVTLTDEEALDLARVYRETGCSESRNRLMLAHLRYARRLAHRHPAVHSGEKTLEEMFSITCEALLISLRSFDPDKNAKAITYLHYRLPHAILDILRREDTVPRKSKNFTPDTEQANLWRHTRSLDDEKVLHLTAPQSVDPADRVAVREALSRLPERSRQVVIMRHVLDYSFTEIGKHFGFTDAWAWGVDRVAREQLRDMLGFLCDSKGIG